MSMGIRWLMLHFRSLFLLRQELVVLIDPERQQLPALWFLADFCEASRDYAKCAVCRLQALPTLATSLPLFGANAPHDPKVAPHDQDRKSLYLWSAPPV